MAYIKPIKASSQDASRQLDSSRRAPKGSSYTQAGTLYQAPVSQPTQPANTISGTTQKQADAAARQVEIERAAGLTNSYAQGATVERDNRQNTIESMQMYAQNSADLQRKQAEEKKAAEQAAALPAEMPGQAADSSPLQTTRSLEEEENANKAEAANLSNQMDTLGTDIATSAAGEAPLYTAQGEEEKLAKAARDARTKELQNIRNGIYSTEQQARIDEAAKAAEAEGNQAIREAEKQKEQGMPKALIAAGQRGGLMNTQFAGVAALLQTEGNTFVGAGGELERIQSSYDSNIADARDRATIAINNAKENARNAIESGAREDLELAQRDYEEAKAAWDEQRELQRQKQADIAAMAKQEAEFNKLKGEENAKTIENMVNAGFTPEDIPAWKFQQMDIDSGQNPGSSQIAYLGAYAEKQRVDAKNDLNMASDFAGLFKNMQVGGPPVTIGDSTYSMLDHGDESTGTESGAGGQYLWTRNNETGELTVRKFGPPNEMKYVDFKSDQGPIVRVYEDGTRRTFDPTQPDMGVPNPASLQQQFPDGWKPSAAEMAKLGLDQLVPSVGGVQCGQMVRFWSGYNGPSLSSFAAKKAIIDPDIGAADGSNPPQAGDAFIQSGGTWGHIGMVLGSTRLQDGSYQIDVLDANSKGDGVIRYHTINSKNVLGFAREGFGFKEEYQFGTDAPTANNGAGTQRLTFGGNREAPVTRELNGVTQQWDPEKGWINPTTEGGAAPTPKISIPQQADLRQNIAKDKAIVQFQDLASSFNSMESIANATFSKPSGESRASLDQALVTLFNKMLDPGSVVREGEYARTAEGQDLISRAQGAFASFGQGGAGITDDTRRDMVAVAKSLKDVAKKSYDESVDYWVPILEDYGLDPTRYIKGYSTSSQPTTTVQSLKTQYPDYESGIDAALAKGYTLEQIEQMLSNAQ